jgi:hypothetical protein
VQTVGRSNPKAVRGENRKGEDASGELEINRSASERDQRGTRGNPPQRQRNQKTAVTSQRQKQSGTPSLEICQIVDGALGEKQGRSGLYPAPTQRERGDHQRGVLEQQSTKSKRAYKSLSGSCVQGVLSLEQEGCELAGGQEEVYEHSQLP